MTTASTAVAAPPFRRELHPAPISVSRRDEIHAAPGFGRYFTDHMVLIDYDDRVRLARPAGRPVRPVQPRSGDHGAALRPGDLRGAEGLSRSPTARWPRSGRSRTRPG